MDATVTAAVVAGGVSFAVSLVGAAVAVVTAGLQVNSKAEELAHQIRLKTDELTQAQLRDVILKRIEVYPKLWSIAQTMLSDWDRLEKPISEAWARTLLTNLIEWHAENGAFLSQDAYEAFTELRRKALHIVKACEKGQLPTKDDLEAMDLIYSQRFTHSESGKTCDSLATCLKNDLGSYKVPALTVN